MATTEKMIFLKDWFEEISSGDEFIETSPQEIAYLLYAAARYSYYGEKTNIGEVFGREYNGLNRTMSGYYGQIERVIMSGDAQGKKNQKYDNEAIQALAAQGVSQADICLRLGYDVSKSKSLSSNPGYKEGRRQFLTAGKEKQELAKTGDSFNENCQELATVFDF